MNPSTLIIPALKITDDAMLPGLVRSLQLSHTKSKHVIEFLTKKGYGEDHELCLITTTKTGDTSIFGVTAKVLKISSINANAYKIIVQMQERVQILSFLNAEDKQASVEVTFSPFRELTDQREVPNLLESVLKVLGKDHTVPLKSSSLQEILGHICVHNDLIPAKTRIAILENGTMDHYFQVVSEALQTRIIQKEVLETTDQEVLKKTRSMQKEAIIRQQIKALQEQLSESGDETEELEERIAKAAVPDEVRKELNKQAKRVQQMQPTSSEYPVTVNYIETLLNLPWDKSSEGTPLTLVEAKEVLDQHHHGLEKTKKRILEYLAVCALKPDLTPPLICLVGPPGTGKSTIAKSIAETLGRKFERISLGGVSDENEMRGHRRTYVGAMPGRFIKALLKTQVNDPVILLDEIDKLGRDFRGDPAAALLEILDPDQNATFMDHYVDVPVDLSKCVFVATANDLSKIPTPLRDRMEVIEIPSYTLHEKVEIAANHLFPRIAEKHGLLPIQISFTSEVLEALISGYTLEAGVRSLGKKIADICRHVALKVATGEVKIYELTESNFFDILGPPRHEWDKARSKDSVGVVTGLAWTPFGGDILSLEVALLPGKGDLKITGNLGDVMKESAQAAWSVLRTQYHENLDRDTTWDMHLHVPAGATPKDGPSAGVTIATAMLSAHTRWAVPANIAMSGEITITGDVLPVGGVREKVIAAHRAGIKKIFLPKACERDMHEIPKNVLEDLEIIFVQRYEQIAKHIFGI